MRIGSRWLVLASTLLAAPTFAGTLINGAGATFPYPIYSKWFDTFRQQQPEIQINYQSIGSGGGIRQVLEGTVDFGATDGPMSDQQLSTAKRPVLHFPTVLGAVVPTWNLPGVTSLTFSPEAIAGIYLGKITRWNDAVIARDNPGVTLPDAAIVPIHRSDGSGTTYVFTDYLSKVSPDWQKSVGKGTSVAFPVGLGGKGNEGVSGLVKTTPNSIGYVELIYAMQTKLPVGTVKNKAGTAVSPTLASVTAAAASVPMPDDFRVSITDAAAPDAYPIASFTWLLIPTTITDPVKGKAIKDFLKWMLADGQGFAAGLHYAPLPKAVIEQELKALDRITVAAG